MLWELAHSARAHKISTAVQLEAATSSAAIETLRGQLPEGELILYVRRLDG